MTLTTQQEDVLCQVCPQANTYWRYGRPSGERLKIIRQLQRKRLVHLHHGHWRTTIKGREMVLGWMADE